MKQKVFLGAAFLSGLLACFIASSLSIFSPSRKVMPFCVDSRIRFPGYADKYRSKALMTPKKYFEWKKLKGGEPSFKPPKALIMVVDPGLVKNLLGKYRTKQCDGCFKHVYFLEDYPSIAFAELGFTGARAVVDFELLIAWGVKKAIFIGTSCGLQPDLQLGDLFVCERAIRDEGTSCHYLPHEKYVYPSEKLKKSLLSTLEEMNKPYKLGTIWTIDAFFRVTQEEVRHYQKEGVLAVEMEMAPLFAVGAYRGVDVISLGTRTDTYANLVWEKDKGYKEAKYQALEGFFDIAVRTAKKVA